MTQETLIPETMPLYFQCLSVPVEWRRAIKKRPPANRIALLLELNPPKEEQDGDLLEVEPRANSGDVLQGSIFDAWEKRLEFFKLKRGDTKALLAFLRTVGLFERPRLKLPDTAGKPPKGEAVVFTPHGLRCTAAFDPTTSENYIWEMRRLIQGSLEELSEHNAKHTDFQVRLVEPGKNKKARLTLTTTNFVDALLITLYVDQVTKAKVRKCKRKDCGATFSFTGKRDGNTARGTAVISNQSATAGKGSAPKDFGQSESAFAGPVCGVLARECLRVGSSFAVEMTHRR